MVEHFLHGANASPCHIHHGRAQDWQANDNVTFQVQKVMRGGGGSSNETRPVRRELENHSFRTVE